MSGDDDVEAKKAKKEREKKEKDEQIRAFANSVTLDDIVWDDDESKWILVSTAAQNKRTRLQSIKGKDPTKLSVPHLRKVCVKLQISGYRDADKAGYCELIVKAAKTKNLKQSMYSSGNANATNSTATAGGKKKKGKKKKKKGSKGTKPKCVTKEGTYYRSLLTLFAQDLRPDVVKLGNQPSKSQLDKRILLHADIFNKMVKVYNNNDRQDLAEIASQGEFYKECNVDLNVPSDFDELTAEEMSELLDFLNFHFKARMTKCKQSGNHDRFASFVRDKPYLFLYWELQQEGPIEIQNLAIPELPEGARRDSSNPSSNKAGSKKPGRGVKKDPIADALKEVSLIFVRPLPATYH